jgi:hypothetical protein
MRGRIALVAVLIAAAAVPFDAAQAQLSPQGILGGITRPFRQILGHLGHYPRGHRRRDASAEPRPATPTPGEPSTVAASRLGVAGPPAWPSAYEEVIGFAFWPDDYASRLRARGFDVIADTISGRSELPRGSARTATTGATVNDAASAADRCGDLAPPQDKWPASRVQQILQLSDAQHETVDKLEAAVTQSVKSIQGTCQEADTLTPPERLRALVQTLWAVRDAGVAVREPVKAFYDTLNGAQKNGFASHQPQMTAPPDPKAGDTGANRQFQACTSQNAERAERLVKEIKMRVRPNKDQASSLENLHKASADMAKLMIASCVKPIPADPMTRLDAANDQLTAMNYAATTVQIAFDDFYGRLDREQKARFESLPR